MRSVIVLALCLLSLPAGADLLEFRSGHVKGAYQLGSYPDDSVFRDLLGAYSQDESMNLRLLGGGRQSQFDWSADYQFAVQSGDTLALRQSLAGSVPLPGVVPDDQRRLLDLTRVISEREDRVIVHRLDRLYAGFTGDKTVLRVGRQVVSWGNGLIYNPVDFFNPFDPAAIDKEYKSGDDMLYGQYLQDSGNDWQAVSVWRRDADGDTGNSVNTSAVKYHAFVGEYEWDVVAAQHFEDEMLATGGVATLGGAIARGDILYTHSDDDSYFSAVANLSYSWVCGDKNVSGALEYFYNGLGLRESSYARLEQETDLLDRLRRGELYTIGRHYLAGALTVEVNPLLQLAPNLFVNLEDGSGLAQLVARYDLHQDWQVLAAANVPFGSGGTEFGGLESGVPGRRFSSGPSLFAQLAFYF